MNLHFHVGRGRAPAVRRTARSSAGSSSGGKLPLRGCCAMLKHMLHSWMTCNPQKHTLQARGTGTCVLRTERREDTSACLGEDC